MSRRGLPSAYERANQQQMLVDPNYLNHVAMSNFGMDARTLDSVLNVMMSVSQGNMPSNQHMAPIYAQAAQKYGWGKDRVQQELRKAISQASPQERIASYLSANNMERVDPSVYRKATELVQHGLRGDLEASIQNRLADGAGNNAPRDNFSGMKASERVLEDSRDKSSMRQMLEAQMGKSAPTLQSRLEGVLKARSELADRVEAKAITTAKGYEPSLRESLADTYDLKSVDAASRDLGLGSPLEEAREEVESTSAHLAEDYDVTANLND